MPIAYMGIGTREHRIISNNTNQYSYDKNNACNLNFIFFFVQFERCNENYCTCKCDNTYSFP